MHKGDRELGLEELIYAINNTVFLKVESILFMSLIQLNYENDLNSAASYAERLVKDYPGNTYYRGHFINILLHQHRYDYVRELLELTAGQEDTYSDMIRTFAGAFLAEKEAEEDIARLAYLETIALAETIGPFADIYQAMGFIGLSRFYKKRGLHKKAKEYFRKATRLTHYDFILEE